MKTFLIFILAIMVSVLPFIIVYLVANWRRIVLENKKRVFRIRTDGENWFKDKPMWVVEKRFLWFYVDCSEILDQSHFFTYKEATESLSKYIEKLDKKQNPESFIVDYTKFISDPKKLIEAKKLETKRIDYDKD